MSQRNLRKEKLFTVFVFVALLFGAMVAGTVVGPDGTYDANYSNATIGNFVNIFIDGANVTAQILAGGSSHGHDQDLNTTDDVSFDTVNATTEFYRAGNNYTAEIEALIAAGGGAASGHDQDLNTTDDVSFSTVNATTEFYRAGNNYTAWIENEISLIGSVANATTGYDFKIITLAGNYVVINGSNGQALGSYADLTDAHDDARDNLTAGQGGSIEFGYGMFYLNNPADPLYYDGSTLESIVYTGQGMYATMIEATAATDIFKFEGGARIVIRDIGMDLDGENGYGIHGTEVDGSSIIHGVIDNVVIRGVNTGYYGVKIKNPSYMESEHLRIYCNGGGGMMLVNDYTNPSEVNRGNSKWESTYIQLDAGVSDAIAILLTSVDDTRGILNMMEFDNTQILALAGGAATNRSGVWLYNVWRTYWYATFIENMENYNIFIGGTGTTRSGHNIFNIGYLTGEGDLIHIDNDRTRNNAFYEFECQEQGAAVAQMIVEEDTVGSVYGGQTYHNVIGQGTFAANYILVNEESELTGRTGLGGSGIANHEYAENWVIAELANDDWAEHNLISVDSGDLWGWVSVLEIDADYTANVVDFNATHVQVSIWDLTAAGVEANTKTCQLYLKYKATDSP